MTIEAVADLPAEQEQAADLDSIISGAIEAAEPPPDPQTDNQTDERPRDERGRFASKEPAAGETPADKKAAPIDPAKPAEAVAPQSQPAAQQPQQLEPHPRWNEATKAKFASLPTPEAKQFVLEVQREGEAAFTRKAQELSELRRTVDPWMQAVNPFAEYLAKVAPTLGATPPELIRQILSAEYSLRTGTPQQKYQTFVELAQSYGVDLAALSRGEIAQPDPLITQLRQQIHDLTNWRTQFEQQSAQAQQQSLSVHIDTFANAKDERGQPRYPHFERVRAPMAQLLASGQASSLEEAYAQAIAPINEAVAAELSARQQAAEKERTASLEKARKAAPLKTSGTRPGGKVEGSRDLDSILNAAIEKAGVA